MFGYKVFICFVFSSLACPGILSYWVLLNEQKGRELPISIRELLISNQGFFTPLDLLYK